MNNYARPLAIFSISFFLVFLMVLIPKIGLNLPTLRSPVSENLDPFASVYPKLNEKTNEFTLKKGSVLSGSGAFIKSVDAASDYDNLSSYGVINFDTGEVLAQKNFSNRVPIASLTKLMTAVIALDLAKPSDIFTIPDSIERVQPTNLGLIPGQKITLEELLNGVLLTSANDAAQVVKEGVDGEYGGDVFIRAMNEKAKIVGLKNSSFTNPQGFDNEKNFSSVEDLSILTHYALINYPQISQIVKKDYQFYPANENHKQIDMYNWNGLLGVYPGTEGVKIGNTEKAGYTSIVLSQREGKSILAVGLGAPGVLERDLWGSELLDLGFGKLGIGGANITKDQLKAKYATWRYFQ